MARAILLRRRIKRLRFVTASHWRQPRRAAIAAITADNSYVLFVNGRRVAADENWETVEVVPLTDALRVGANELLVVAKNGGAGPNPAALYFESRIVLPDSTPVVIATDASWEWTAQAPNAAGKFASAPKEWGAAIVASRPETWSTRVAGELTAATQLASQGRLPMSRTRS